MANNCSENKRFPENLELFFEMVEYARDGINITQNGVFKYVNKAFCDMIGYTREELCCLKASDILPEREKERMVKQHFDRMEGKGKIGLDFTTLLHKNGTEIDIEFNVSPITYDGGIASFISIRNITERNRMQGKLEQSEKKYRKLFEAESDAIFLIEKETGQILDANPAASENYGYSHEEFLTLRNVDISAEPEKTKESTTNNHSFVPIRYHKKKDGTSFAVEISAGITDLDGREVHIITARDITERIRMQEELTKSESKYRNLIEKSLDGIVISQDGKVIMVNKAFADMIGYSVEECLETFGPHSLAPEDRERVLAIHYSRMKGELGDLRYNASIICKNGEKVTAEFNSTTMEINGRLASLISTRDITIQLKMQEALRKSEEHYRQVIQSLQEGLFVLQDDKFIFVNDAIVDILGYTVEEMTGRHFSTVIPPELSEEAIMKNLRWKNGQAESWSY